MSALPTTDAMVLAAQDAYDVAAADYRVAWARCSEAIKEGHLREDLVAKSLVALAGMEYAWAVLVAVREDRAVSA